MKARIGIIGPVAALVVAASVGSALAKDLWIHVRAESAGERRETVRVNIPLALLESVAPLIKDHAMEMGNIKLGSKNLDAQSLRELWKSLRAAEDGEYVTVDSDEENVRVAKSGEHLVVKAFDSRKGKGENVDVKVPLAVIDALLSGSDDELDFEAAIRALKARGEGELVAVDDSDSTVRIWIDGRNSGK
jgi:hypothetical protein